MSRWTFQGKFTLMEKCYCFLCSPFLSRKFTIVVETVFIVSRGNFRRSFPKVLRFLFFWTLSKVFGISPIIFLQDCQNCFLCVQRTFMGQRVFQIKKLFFSFLAGLSKTYLFLVRKILKILSKLHFICPENYFEDFFPGKFVLFLFLMFRQKLFELFSENLLENP